MKQEIICCCIILIELVSNIIILFFSDQFLSICVFRQVIVEEAIEELCVFCLFFVFLYLLIFVFNLFHC
jgi:hypothetical protein